MLRLTHPRKLAPLVAVLAALVVAVLTRGVLAQPVAAAAPEGDLGQAGFLVLKLGGGRHDSFRNRREKPQNPGFTVPEFVHMDRLTAMEVFVAVADRGSQVAAADALGLSRPVVSRHLAALEAWAGARLMHRTTRRLSLTPAGEQMLQRCRDILAQADELRRSVAARVRRARCWAALPVAVVPLWQETQLAFRKGNTSR